MGNACIVNNKSLVSSVSNDLIEEALNTANACKELEMVSNDVIEEVLNTDSNDCKELEKAMKKAKFQHWTVSSDKLDPQKAVKDTRCSRDEANEILNDLKRSKIIEGTMEEAPGGKSWTVMVETDKIPGRSSK